MSLQAEILAAVGTDEACTAGDENSNENDLLLVVVGSLFVSGFEAHDAKLRRPRAGSGEDERICLLYTSPSPRDKRQSRMPSSA